MASGHLGQICLGDGDQRLQDRIHVQTPDNVEGVVDGDSEEPLSKRGPRKRTPVHVGQTGHQGNPGVTRHTQILLPDFPSSQGIGRLEANPEPQGVQQIRSAPFLSDGDTANSHGLPGGGGPTKVEHLRTFEGLQSIRNVGDLYRFKRRLLSRGRGARAYQVPPVRLQRQSLRVPGAPLRPVDGSQSLHAGRKGHRGLPQNSRGRHAPVPRRLVDEESARSLVERHRDLTLFWVDKLGFLVNEGKSQLIPTQTPAFLGSTLDLLNMLVFPSKRRILRATRLAASLLARTAQQAKTWQRFLGHLSSLRELVPMAVVHTRPIQLMRHDQWTQVSDSPYVRIYPNEETLDELEWWASQANLRVGRPFLHPDPTMSIVTDASKEGWEGHLGDLVVSGLWSRAWAKRHINWLELQAVWLTLKHFLPQLQGTAVDVISDNTTTVVYINKVGGTQSPSLCRLALDVWEWCRQHEIFLVASHLSGDRNVLADALSRGSHRHPTEWTLHNAVTSAIFQHWPTPHVDLFASEKNHKLPVIPSSSGVNALTQNWDCLYGYAYPPTALIPRVLRKLRLQPTAQILLVAPFWPSQPWFCQMTSMLTDLPRAISQRDDLLKNAVTGMRYPKPEAMRLTVWQILR